MPDADSQIVRATPIGGISLLRGASAIFLFAVCLGGDIFFFDHIFLFFYLYFTFLALLFFLLLKEKQTLKVSYAIIPLIAFSAICFLSLFWSVRLKDAEIVIISLFTGLLTYFIFSNIVNEENDVCLFLKFIVVATSLNAFLGIFQGTIGGSLFLLFGAATQGTTYHPNYFSGLLGIVYPLSLLVFVRENKGFWLLPPFLILLANLFSTSRGGILTILMISAVSLLFLLSRGYKKSGMKILFVIFLSVLTYLLSTFIGGKLSPHIPKLKQTSIVSTTIRRLEIWQGTLPIVANHPVLGAGLRSFEDEFEHFNNPYVFKYRSNAHNLFLHLASEVGLIGLLFFLGFCLCVLSTSLKNYKRAKDPPSKAVSFFLLLAFSSFLFQNLMEYKWEHSLFQVLFYFTAATTFTTTQFSRPERKEVSLYLKRAHKIGLSGLLFIFWILYVGAPLMGNYYLSRAKHLHTGGDERIFRLLLIASFFDSSNPEPHLRISRMYGNAWLEKGDIVFLEKAMKARQKAISLMPMNGDFLLDLGKFLEEVRRLDEAQTYYEKAILTDPFSPKYKEEFAAFLARKGDVDKAIVFWEDTKVFLEKHEPEGLNLMRTYLHLGRAHKRMGNDELSKRYLHQVIHFPAEAVKEEGDLSPNRRSFNFLKNVAKEELGN